MTTTASSTGGPDGGSSSSRLSSGRISQKQRAPSDGTDSSSCGAREPWISTNKILNSSLCGRRINSRNPNFDYDETKLLIALWGDPVVQKTLITTHKKHPVIAELARKMRDHGYNRSTEEINTRIKNLKCFYNRIKKDMAAGIINQTTWRHYAEMDEIISRPVFGNAHRMHLQQQQQQQTNQEHPLLRQNVRKLSNNETDQGDGAKEALPQFPVKLEVMSDDDDDYEPTEIRAEDLLTIDAKFPDDSPTVPETERTLHGVGNRNGRNGKSVANGKASSRKQAEDDDEDDDEDDEDDGGDEEEEEEEEEEDDDEGSDFDVENEFNDGLDELLQKAQATKSTPGAGGTSVSKTATQGAGTAKSASTSGLVIETITSGNGTTITATGASSTSIPTTNTTGKISVVPTNLLMKQPSTVASSMTAPIQIYTQPTVSIAKGPTGTATTMVASAGGSGPVGTAPMKLLLVNTVAKDGTTQQILTPASEATMPKLIPAPVHHHSKLPLTVGGGGQSPIVTIPTVNVPKQVGAAIKLVPPPGARPAGSGGQSAGFRTLLTQLVAIQRENLALNQERLKLEKERLEFEKQFGGSLVGMVRNMSTFFSGMLQHQRNEQEQLKQPVDKLGSESSIKPVSEQVKTPPVPKITDPEGHETGLEVREISSSSSTASSSVTSTTKTPAPDGGGRTEAKEPTTVGTKRTQPSSTPPPLTPAPSVVKASSTSDVSLPKKRRMMTRNAAQHSQTNNADDPLKTEIISDADDQ
ncbi:F-actin-monooxygenase MICAL3-like [Anopheles maculipalpis]|uniref:F-actin-monooxygenase MICAL3-like n=1 Tax=Anopheles maculipalpis TaxID=1496333 RepID=UPI002159810E|nr:F-actin-monooxygenase MICAL3-like [Anopheles maculipalpis]